MSNQPITLLNFCETVEQKVLTENTNVKELWIIHTMPFTAPDQQLQKS